MLIVELISQALTSLTTDRLRSVLTMLGIIVGVFTVMLTLSLGAGARQAISEQISALGTNLIVVNSGPPPASGQEAVYLYPWTQQLSCAIALPSQPSMRSRKSVSQSQLALLNSRTTL
jgi:putative ABC transport system permease protein